MASVATKAKPQAISGLSPGIENIIRVEYPSIAATWLGRTIGNLCNSIPLKINGIKLSYLLFALPLAPFALFEYFRIKGILCLFLLGMGTRYVLTSKSVQKWTALGARLISEVRLAEISEIVVNRRPGQEFYHAADLELLGADGSLLLRLEGVLRPNVLRQSILEARDARFQVEASLKTIQARRGA